MYGGVQMLFVPSWKCMFQVGNSYGRGYSVRFWIGCSAPPVYTKRYKGQKRGVETIHFAQFWWASVTTKTSAFGLGFCLLSPTGHVFHTARENMIKSYNSFPPGQNGCHFADDIFRCIFVSEKICILIEISLKFVSKGPMMHVCGTRGDELIAQGTWKRK